MPSVTDYPAENERLGDFEIIRQIGRGGMGVVYQARQVSLNRLVALKVLSGTLGLTAKAVERFPREAAAAAQLHHTNIVPVYATGQQDGTHFYAMELIEGPSLDQVIQQLRQARSGAAKVAGAADGLAQTTDYVEDPSGAETTGLSTSSLSSDGHYFDTVARMIADVADALAYMHGHGVIHRDLKPSNLLLSPDGRLSINDFGLARLLEQPGMTLSGEFVGTPRYMSPEQIAAGRTPLDQRTDIYSLGATLYELLTLQPAFLGERRDQVLAQILHKEPKAPRRLNHKVPVDLETICLKALEKDPDRRYQTAGQMAEDLRRFVNRFAISARRAGPLRRLVKWVRRRPGLAAALACAMVLAGAAGFLAYRGHVAERQLLDEQERARQELLAEKRQNALDKAMAAAMSGDLQETEKAIAEAERAGASTGQVHMLRGLVAFYRGEVDKAVQHLEQAVVLLPDSVAARALLANFYDNAGQYGRSEQVWSEMEHLTPGRSEDYLFKGYAEMDWKPAGALQTLDEVIRRHDSVIGRAIRAEVRAFHAWDTADPKDAELALADADIAKGMLPDNPKVLYASVLAHLAAAGAFAETRQSEKQRAALQLAARDVQALERFDTLPAAVLGRLIYCDCTGAEDTSFDLSRRAVEHGTTDDIVYHYTWELYRRGQFPQALEVLGRSRNRDVVTFEEPRAYILAEFPGGPARVLVAFRELSKRCTRSVDMLSCQAVLLLLGRKSEAIATSRRFREKAGSSLLGLYSNPFDYLCGDLSAEGLLKAAGRSKRRLSNSHFYIALTKLADMDRAGAREHFGKVVATGMYIRISHEWSRAFLARMNRDPAWPPWIPLQK